MFATRFVPDERCRRFTDTAGRTRKPEKAVLDKLPGALQPEQALFGLMSGRLSPVFVVLPGSGAARAVGLLRFCGQRIVGIGKMVCWHLTTLQRVTYKDTLAYQSVRD